MTMTPLPVAPSRQRPDDFSTEADAFLSALPTFQTELNDVVDQQNTNINLAISASANATSQANAASSSAGAANVSAIAAGISETNTSVLLANAGSMLGINFGAFTLTDGELIVTHLTTSTPSLVDGELVLTYETL